VIAVQYHEGRKAVAIRFLQGALRVVGDTAVNKNVYNAPIALVPAHSLRTRGKRNGQRIVRFSRSYLALAKQLEIEIPFPQEKRNLPEKPDLELFDEGRNLAGRDGASASRCTNCASCCRRPTLNANETSLCALIHRPPAEVVKDQRGPG